MCHLAEEVWAAGTVVALDVSVAEAAAVLLPGLRDWGQGSDADLVPRRICMTVGRVAGRRYQQILTGSFSAVPKQMLQVNK